MKTSTNLSRSAAGDRRNRAKHLIEAMRMVGYTDAEIRAELEKLAAKRATPTAAPASAEPGQGGADVEQGAAANVSGTS